MKRLVALGIVTLLALAMAAPATADTPYQLTVDGVTYVPYKVVANGTVAHYETPDVNPNVAFTERHWWEGNGSENLPCEGGIHWIDNANVLTISHCLEVTPTSTTSTTSLTSTTSTTEPATTTTLAGSTTTTVPETTTSSSTTTSTTLTIPTTSSMPSTTSLPTTTVPQTTTTTMPTLPLTGASDLAKIALIAVAMLATGLGVLGLARWLEDRRMK